MRPCCIGSLQRGVKITAIIQIVFAAIVIGSGIFALSDEPDYYNKLGRTPAIETSITQLLGGIFSLITAIVLLIGAAKRNRITCMIWFILQSFSLIFSLVSTANILTSEELPYVIGRSVGLLLVSYFLWVVWAFMKELKEEETYLHNGNAKPKPTIQHQFEV